MSNNDIVPDFDEEQPRLEDPFWSNVSWRPIQAELAKVVQASDALIITLKGTLEGFNASYLAGRIYLAIDNGYKKIALDFRNVLMGDYRENLVFPLGLRLRERNGELLLISPPQGLLEYYRWSGLMSLIKRLPVKTCSTREKAIRHFQQSQWNRK